jgi:SAM-dependent methyltransferase
METDEDSAKTTSSPGGRNWILISIALFIFLSSLSKIFNKSIRNLKGRLGAWFLDLYAARFDERMKPRKTAWFDGLHRLAKELGRPLTIVDVGMGNGNNFQYYPKGTRVIGVDPNPFWKEYFAKNKDLNPHVEVVDVHIGYAEKMTMIESGSADVVVSTLLMCSVHHVDKALSEFLRVLKPVCVVTALFQF